ELLLAAFAAVRPDAVVVEGFPFARRAFRFELDPLIAAARAARTPVVCSVRDIPTVRDDPARHAEIVARIQADFAAVLVHGDPTFIPFEVPFPPAAKITGRLAYTGYVTLPTEEQRDAELPVGEVLVSVGGGAGGAAPGLSRRARLAGAGRCDPFRRRFRRAAIGRACRCRHRAVPQRF